MNNMQHSGAGSPLTRLNPTEAMDFDMNNAAYLDMQRQQNMCEQQVVYQQPSAGELKQSSSVRAL